MSLPAPAPSAVAPRSSLLPLALMAVVALLFWDSLPLLPLKLLVVTFHELGHAFAALLTGGEVVEVAVRWDESGHTLTRGGSRFLILSGGYLGSTVWGLGILALSRREGRGALVIGALGLLLWAVALWWIPLLSFGFLYAAAAGAACLWLARRGGLAAELAARSIGLFSVLYALFDIRSDIFQGTGRSDAVMLAELTGVPAVIWGAAWMALSLGALWGMRRRI